MFLNIFANSCYTVFFQNSVLLKVCIKWQHISLQVSCIEMIFLYYSKGVYQCRDRRFLFIWPSVFVCTRTKYVKNRQKIQKHFPVPVFMVRLNPQELQQMHTFSLSADMRKSHRWRGKTYWITRYVCHFLHDVIFMPKEKFEKLSKWW